MVEEAEAIVAVTQSLPSHSLVLCFFFFWSSFSFYTLPILPVTSFPNNLNKWSGLKILKRTARIWVGTVPLEKRDGYCRMTRYKNIIDVTPLIRGEREREREEREREGKPWVEV